MTGALAGAANEALTKTVNAAIEKALPEPKVKDPLNPTDDEKAQLRDNALSRKALAESAAQLLGASAVALGGGNAQDVRLGANVALTADRNNRQLHETEYQRARDLAKNKLVREKLSKMEGREITERELEGRLVAEMLRNSDASASAQSGGVSDYKLRSLVGCAALNCNASKTDPDYAKSAVNSQYLAANWGTFDNGFEQLTTGQTYNQLVTKNVKDNPVSTGIAGVGMVGYGVVIGGPTTVGVRLFTGSVGAAGNAAFQSTSDQPMDWVDVSVAGFTGFVTGGGGFWQGLRSTVAINTGGALTGSAIKKENPNAAVGSAAVGTVVGYGTGKAIESVVKIKVDPLNYPDWVSAGPYGIVKNNAPSSWPFISGTVGSSAAQELSGDSFKNYLNKTQKSKE